MKKLIQSAGGVLFLFMAQTIFACDYPTRVEVPDGASASREQMIDTQSKVKTFQADMQTYLKCIEDEEAAARALMQDLEPEVEQQREEMLTKKYNAAVEDEEKLVASFNAAIRDYREANSN